MRLLAAAIALLLAGIAPGHAQNCTVNPELVEAPSFLPRVNAAVTKEGKLAILVISAAPSQVGQASGLKSYPSFLETTLKEKLKETNVSVFAFAVPREPIGKVLKALPGALQEHKPDLVIWQTGTIEAIRAMDPDVFGDKLLEGVSLIKADKIDVILMNQQYSPRTDFMFDGTPYTDNMRWVAQSKDISLFNRYEIMKYWADNGVFDLNAMKSDGTYEKLHRCLGGLLADFVLRGASLPGSPDNHRK
ncbi:MAG TPA: hypothetical protein VNR41_12905 [Xanthobacteraceae bacterium]|nr:hypothetical protein [Xanthobacteraceae bacterium]